MECPGHCPANCRMEEMMCTGGEDPNGCIMPEFCIPSKGTTVIFNQAVSKLIILITKDQWARMVWIVLHIALPPVTWTNRCAQEGMIQMDA